MRNIIVSEEDKFWKFITKNKYLNTNRINLDINRLESFYKNRGYFNVDIKSTYAVINENNQFELIFNINANKKYYFRNFVFQTNENFPLENIDFFQNKFNKLKDDLYSKKRIDDLIDEINDFTLQNDFVFINANFKEVIKDEDKKIIINFKDLDNFMSKELIFLEIL